MGVKKKIARDGNGEVQFAILSDPDHKTIDSYGLIEPKYGDKGIPKPAIYILDKNRKILWAKVETDYRFRPTNEEIRTQLDKIGNASEKKAKK